MVVVAFYASLGLGGCLRILVTGVASFIGSHTVDRLLAEGVDL